MTAIGAGLAAFGILGPGLGLGILTGMAVSAIGRNPDAANSIRTNFILGAVLAEGLGIFAFVLGVLIIILLK